MKKTLVALAALASVSAFAQSTVTIDGVMDGNYTAATRYGQGFALVSQSGARTTSIKFTGSEDLGSGMKANFRFEVQPSIIAGNANALTATPESAAAITANATAQTSGQASAQSGLVGKGYSFVGVSGGFGEVQLGSINTAYLATFLNAAGRTGTGIGSMWNLDGSIPDVGRVETAAAYFTPTIAGFSGRYLLGTGNDSQYGATTGTFLRRNTTNEISLAYAQGPLSVRFSNTQVKTGPNEATATATAAAASNVTTTYSALSGSYTAGNLTLGAYSMSQKDNAGLDTGSVSRQNNKATMMLYTTYQMGATRLLLNAGNRKTNAAYASTTNLAGLKTTFTGYGVEYDLSKRTYVYFRGSNMNANDLVFSSNVANGAALTAVTLICKGCCS